MMTVTKGEETQTAEQLKVWPSSNCQSAIKVMVWNLTGTGSALGWAISHTRDLLGTSKALPLEIHSWLYYAEGLGRHLCSRCWRKEDGEHHYQRTWCHWKESLTGIYSHRCSFLLLRELVGASCSSCFAGLFAYVQHSICDRLKPAMGK